MPMGRPTLKDIKSARTCQEGIGNRCHVLQHDRLLVRGELWYGLSSTWLAEPSGINFVQNRLRVRFGANSRFSSGFVGRKLWSQAETGSSLGILAMSAYDCAKKSGFVRGGDIRNRCVYELDIP